MVKDISVVTAVTVVIITIRGENFSFVEDENMRSLLLRFL
ncbi:15743_t:CDS:2 [Funneliformis caledonium]|uniref:15743_t:CDS:1 n=1 Tax=Funneliformis caledonium TaxID=1117310 RepID=A0A9N9G997_9GLOM|nr:15743_t:CDS:2 [Funneliformis caledonium]